MLTGHEAADVVVIGTGPGGASVAQALARRGAAVRMLDRGDNAPLTGTLGQTLRNLGMPGRGLVLTTSGAPVARGITVGGSSVHYYATAYAPPVEAFATYGIDLVPYVEQTKRELPIAPLRDSLIGPMAHHIRRAAQALGFDWQALPKFMDQERCRTGCHRCQYGCPYGAKWTARNLVQDAVAAGAKLETGARVIRVLHDGRRTTGVAVRQHGQTRTIQAGVVVLAAGGIGSPQVLEVSGVPGTGRDFFTDPLVAVFGMVPRSEISGGGHEVPMATGMRFADDGYVMTDMTLPPALYRGMAAARGRLHRLSSHGRALTIMVKIRDDLGGRLLSNGLIHKPLTRADRAKLDHGSARAASILKECGATGIFRSPVIAAHPGGTAKLGEVVDADLRTSIQNLYVCDCSVIPKPWGLPPTWTLLCLGRRLGDHLAGHA